MISKHGLRVIVALAMMNMPMIAMHAHDPKSKALRSIYKILLGANDDQPELYDEGIAYIRKQQSYIKGLSFSTFKLLPTFEHMLLKVLVVHKEKDLLPDFLDMYRRSYPQSREGINFTYKLEKQNGRKQEIIEYTLLDVALTAYAEAAGQKQAGGEAEIMQLLIDHGGELKLYRGINLQESPTTHRKKRCRKEDDRQTSQSEATQPSIHPPVPLIPTDVGPLLDIKETGDDDNIALESGALVRFDLDDYK
jgi:hypothetical protein